jgi:hypothetical protein
MTGPNGESRAAADPYFVRTEVWEGIAHGFVGSVGRLDAAAQALHAIGAFVSGRSPLFAAPELRLAEKIAPARSSET